MTRGSFTKDKVLIDLVPCPEAHRSAVEGPVARDFSPIEPRTEQPRWFSQSSEAQTFSSLSDFL